MGNYIADDGTRYGFALKNNKLYMQEGGKNSQLVKGTKDTLVMRYWPVMKIVFTAKTTKEIIVNEYDPYNHRRLVKYNADAKQTDEVLRTYTGTYYCPELDCNYRIVLKDHHLILTNSKYNDTPLTLYGDNHLTDGFWWMDNLLILRNAKNQITGFEVNSGRIRHLLFKKENRD